MRLGILSESKDDTTIIKALCRGIITEAFNVTSQDIIFPQPIEAHSSVLGRMPLATEAFFEHGRTADLIVFGVDLDNQGSTRKKRVNKFIADELAKSLDRTIIPLYSDPHIEAHFIAEGGNAVKQILTGLNPADPLPYSGSAPKSQMGKLIDEFAPSDEYLTRTKIYSSIGEALNLDLLARMDPDFKRFREKLVASIATRGLF